MRHKRITQRIATGVLASIMLFTTLVPAFGSVVYADDVSGNVAAESNGSFADLQEPSDIPEASIHR